MSTKTLASAASHAAIQDRGTVVFAVVTSTLVLASVFVAARIICRHFIVHNVSWDDRIMMLAWLIAFFLSFTIDLGVSYGLGRHDADIPSSDWPTLRRCEYVFTILYNPALMATKTSILVFYLRLAKNTQLVLRYASWATLAVVLLAGTVLTFMNIFQCDPVSFAWSPSDSHQAKCIPILTEFICSAPVNIITDLVILALPIPVLTNMRLPRRQKTILVLTFGFGVFVTIVDVVRIYYLQHAITAVPTTFSSDPEATFGDQPQFAWNASISLMWSAVEVNVGMACACVPTLKPLILKLLPAMLYDPHGTKHSSVKGPHDSDTPSPQQDPNGPSPRPPAGGDEPFAAMEFITTPDFIANTDSGPSIADAASLDRLAAVRASTIVTAATATTADSRAAQENDLYFGFVNMARPKSMLLTSNSESLKYCVVVSILFFMWGVSYGLLNTLNNVVAAVNHESSAETLGLTSIYWGGGYFLGPLLVGDWTLRRDEHNRSKRHQRDAAERVGGFKVTFQVGVAIYGIGTMIFWPSAVTGSYGGFMLSNFVVGFGIAVVEVGANSFMILCGPPEYGETRLLLAQGVQAIGSILSGVLAEKVFFTGIAKNGYTNSMTLINVQWTYLGITLLCCVLDLFFFYMPLPEAADSELEEAADRLPVNAHKKSVFGLELRTVSLVLAILAQYMYVGTQESNETFFRALMLSILPNQSSSGDGAATTSSEPGENKPVGITLSIPDYLLIGSAAFAVSRFLAAYITYLSVSHRRIPKPRTLLAICVALCFLFSLLPVVIHPKNADLLVIPVVLFFFAEGPIWPLIFTLGLRGQGKRTKRAAVLIVMSASGGAWPPFLMYGIITLGGTVQLAFLTIVGMTVVMFLYPLFLEGVRDMRMLLDPCPVDRSVSRADEETPRLGEAPAA